MRTMMTVVIGAVMLAGCGGGEADEAVAPAATPAALSNAQEQVIALHPRLQQGVMLRAIRDAGLTCQAVTELSRVDDMGGKARWRVVCDKTEPYVVEIDADGTARIRSRR